MNVLCENQVVIPENCLELGRICDGTVVRLSGQEGVPPGSNRLSSDSEDAPREVTDRNSMV